jgi:NAD(P)-dependent dehydrogenase (short-subunit alcohol dehydrogenase family)
MVGMFEGKVGLVTGGGSGMGRATSRLFAERGGSVLVADISEAAALETVETIRGQGGKAEACRCDVTGEEETLAVTRQARERFGRLDVVVHCAGIMRVDAIEATSLLDWNETLRVNLTGAFLMTKAAMAALREQGGGAIVHIASRMALQVKENHAAYAASKAGVLQLTKMAALEGAPHRIRVNCVCPGIVDTPLLRPYGTPEELQRTVFANWSAVCPLGRPAQPEDVARAMLFLASDEAAYITGVALPVDGGRTIL